MLHLKRASAGSGKTYELAKTYIKFLLTTKQPRKSRLWREETASLRDALREIMAVTFTVKATAEMKQRIVEKLAALASADKVLPEDRGKIDYMQEFLDDYRINELQLSHMARAALRTLLLHYSDFKVQTIDSFFQSILHTFTYEANLDENFNMEIDTDYVATVGFDAALDSIAQRRDTSKDSDDTLEWLKLMMEDKSNSSRWNVFARSEGKHTLYRQLINEAKNLEKEEFQKKRRELEKYFECLNVPFIRIAREIDEKNLAPWRRLHDERKRSAEVLKGELYRAGLRTEDLYWYHGGTLNASLAEFDIDSVKMPPELNRQKGVEAGYSLKKDTIPRLEAILRENPALNRTILHDIDSSYDEWRIANNEYRKAFAENGIALLTWKEYRKMFPQLMMVLEISRKKNEFLESTNSLVISDTTHILSEIIGDDDTPFVYERMGSRLNHYLIDEFQDTSRMQWNNLRPLLAESESRGEDNLIIGDAKQSIYRFRNADYRLITEEVEKEFPIDPDNGESREAGSAQKNTNYRSSKKIVDFNNFIFSQITDLPAPGEKKNKKQPARNLFSDRIKRIYADSLQELPKKAKIENAGYAEICLYPPLTDEEKKNFESVGDENLGEPGFVSLPSLILNIRERGYRFRDIGVLVKTRDQGKAAVKVINAHNSACPDARIPIISEENLLVGSSLAVRLVIHALEIAAGGRGGALKTSEVLKEPIDETALFELLSSLQSMALPSVVEAVTAEFVPPARKDADAPFLAAFQDAVLDYCASHTSDIGSFLKWWKRKSKSLSINSPEESDGVRILTIHKAKGLEYQCVILPKANINFAPSALHREWKWVRPSHSVADFDLLPPFLPVETSSKLLETEHKELWEKYEEEVSLDELNKMYVGFTRAIDELYVFAPIGAKEGPSMGWALSRLLECEEKLSIEGEPIRIMEPSPLGSRQGSRSIVYGEPRNAKREETARDSFLLDAYEVKSDRRVLRFQDANTLINPEEGETAEEIDPRSEGTLKHRIMQMVRVPEDLERSLLEMRVGGLISHSQADLWKEELRAAISSVESYGWFSPEVRVLNERTLIRKGEENYRPDRMVITPQGKAIVIDYKFGAPEKSYKQQVKNYADRLAATGRFGNVESYLWYVKEGCVVKVTG